MKCLLRKVFRLICMELNRTREKMREKLGEERKIVGIHTVLSLKLRGSFQFFPRRGNVARISRGSRFSLTGSDTLTVSQSRLFAINVCVPVLILTSPWRHYRCRRFYERRFTKSLSIQLQKRNDFNSSFHSFDGVSLCTLCREFSFIWVEAT